jgi:hypothetical protein
VQCPVNYTYVSDKSRDLIMRIICVLSSAGRVTTHSDNVYKIMTKIVQVAASIVTSVSLSTEFYIFSVLMQQPITETSQNNLNTNIYENMA